MVLQQIRKSRAAAVSGTFTHSLAWAAFLWLALWPYSYLGISAAAVSVDGRGTTTTEGSILGLSNRGQWILGSTLFVCARAFNRVSSAVNVNLEGQGRAGNTLILGGLAVVLLIFSVLGILPIDLFYLPAAIASRVTAIIFGFRHVLPRPND